MVKRYMLRRSLRLMKTAELEERARAVVPGALGPRGSLCAPDDVGGGGLFVGAGLFAAAGWRCV